MIDMTKLRNNFQGLLLGILMDLMYITSAYVHMTNGGVSLGPMDNIGVYFCYFVNFSIM